MIDRLVHHADVLTLTGTPSAQNNGANWGTTRASNN
ncbi:hypothetical protein [Rhodococcus wratislaviensis]|nr:hypothetical protein [Rhodococcus wratislaviensis]